MKYTKPSLMALGLTLNLTGATTFRVGAQTTPKKPDAKQTKPAVKKTVAEVKYKAHCGMIYSAVDAKKYHYICPMDHQRLIKIAANAKSGKTASVKR